MSDISNLIFVDPNTVDSRWRIVLFGPPGAGKTTAACSAPGPIVAMSADRPGAYRYARREHADQTIMEARFNGYQSLRDLYDYTRENQAEIGTVVLDPFNLIYDGIVDENTNAGGKPNWQKVNKLAVDLIKSFRDLDVNLVLCAHEKRDEDENGDTEAKVYPSLGGPALIQKLMAEVDIVARVFRKDATEDAPESWQGQLVHARGYQCKDSSGSLGRVRELDLAEWIATANEATQPDDSDVPFLKPGEAADDEPEAKAA